MSYLNKAFLEISDITCKKTLRYGVSFCVHEQLPFSAQYLAIYDGYTNCENLCQNKRRGQLV